MKPNGYQLWFDADGGKTRIQLPVNPESITVKNSANNESMTVADFGEITILRERSAAQISFSGIFPAEYFPGCSVKKPLDGFVYVNFFTGCMEKKNPVRFIVTKRCIVKYVTIESFTYSESGGDVGTLEYSLTLKEYRSTKVRQIKLDTDKKAVAKALMNKKNAARVSTKSAPKTYTVKPGDCLWNIAKKYYGDGSKYTKIYDANKKTIGSNPNLIYPGQVLAIP